MGQWGILFCDEVGVVYFSLWGKEIFSSVSQRFKTRHERFSFYCLRESDRGADIQQYFSFARQIRHVNEYPTMHYFRNPRQTKSINSIYNFDWVFLEIPVKNCTPFCTSLDLLLMVVCNNEKSFSFLMNFNVCFNNMFRHVIFIGKFTENYYNLFVLLDEMHWW